MIAWLTVIHITGIVFWMGTLLLLTRIMAFHATQGPDVSAALATLEKKLFFGGAVAGLVLALVSGTWLLVHYQWGPLDATLHGSAFHIKLTLVAILIGLTVWLKMLMPKVQDKGPGLFKALHGVTAALFMGVLAVFFVMYRG